MRFGVHSTIEFQAMRLLYRWVPKWHAAFLDAETGLFHERLGDKFFPLDTVPRRLLTQCRQLAVYSHASRQPGCVIPGLDLRRNFTAIRDAYEVGTTGGWRFSTDDPTYDLYTLSFVIFACAHYARATGDEAARQCADRTLEFIDQKFRTPNQPGLVEALDPSLTPLPRTRRQNPHMHLLEACLFAQDVWGGTAYKRMADEMVDLFHRFFYKDGALIEFFDDSLHPHPEQGGRVEPGHYFEWIWLLKKHGSADESLCAALLDWANHYGWDDVYGGIYDVLSPDGTIIADTKRIWPFSEGLKANALMLDGHTDRDAVKARIAAMIDLFRNGYMQERGFWSEWLSRDLKPQTDYMPGTTPYHVYFGIMETWRILNARGRSMSVAAGPARLYYKTRRDWSRRLQSWVKSR